MGIRLRHDFENEINCESYNKKHKAQNKKHKIKSTTSTQEKTYSILGKAW